MAGTVSKGPSGTRSESARAGGQTGRGTGSQGRTGGDGPRGGLMNAGGRTVGGSGLGGRSSLGGPARHPGGLRNMQNYQGAMTDATQNDIGTQAFSFLSGLREMNPTRGNPASYTGGRAAWGADPMAMLGGLAGSALGPGAGLLTGAAAGYASSKLGHPLGMFNLGQDIMAGKWGYDRPGWMGGSPRASQPSRVTSNGSPQPGSMNPALSGGGGFGRSRQGGNSGQNRRTLTVPGYISGLLS